MKFVCISDTHGLHKKLTIPEADMIIHSGDFTGRGKVAEIKEFCEWYGKLPHKHKILIAGNHDWGFQTKNKECVQICKDNGITYLQDSHVIIDGLKIHGSPQTPEFAGWAFNCWRTEKEEQLNDEYHGGYKWIGRFWKMIPDDVDILITHGPPMGILDYCDNGYVGCVELLKHIEQKKPTFHIFGHIHEGRGEEIGEFTTHINASSLDGWYRPYPAQSNVYTIGE